MRRKILEDPTCERSKQAVEDSIHALWLCPELDVVWSDQRMWGFRYEVGFVNVKELLLWMVDEGKSLELLAFPAWSVWNQRNKARLNLQSNPLHQVAAQSRTILMQYRADLQASEVQVRSNDSGEKRWTAPPNGFVKVNFDGANAEASRMFGVGVVIRDSDGAVLASCAKKFNQPFKAEDTEALVAMKALSFAHELGFQNIVHEGDALNLIQVLKAQEQNLLPWGLLVEDVKEYGTKFRRVLYSHVKRNCNSVAHNLAKHVLCILNFQVWMKNVPSYIVQFLQLDVTHLR